MKCTTAKFSKNNHALMRLRRSLGYRSAKAFADKIGISASSYARYECYGGTNIPMHAAWQIADYLDCSIDEIVGRREPVQYPFADYEKLSDKSKTDLKEYIEYLESRDKIDEWKSKHGE